MPTDDPGDHRERLELVLDPLGDAAMLAYDLAGIAWDGRLLDRVGVATTA